MSHYGARKGAVQKCANNCCCHLDCGSVHLYKYCFAFQNTVCRNNKCLYLHCTSIEQLCYETTGIATERLKREVGRTLQHINICGEFKTGVCNHLNCKWRHIKYDETQNESLECPICTEAIIMENFGAGECGHIFCSNCALHFLCNEEAMKVRCPICRYSTEFKKLM